MILSRHIIFLAVLVVAVCGGVLYSNWPKPQVSFSAMDVKSKTATAPTASPIPFSELTIPYLRGRTYDSQIEEMVKVSETSTYESYRVSYLSDGFRIYGQLTLPKETESLPKPKDGWPGVVFVHGYIPPSLYKTFGNYNSWVDALAKSGLTVLKIDLRGHDQSEGEASGAYYSSGYVVDTLHAYRALQKLSSVNPNKVGLFGHSMAGNVTMRSAVIQQNIPKVVIWAGAVYTYQDMRDFGISDNSYRPRTTSTASGRNRELLRATHGDFDAGSAFWQQVVPTNYLDGVKTAFQFHHPIDDAVVNVKYSRNVVPILQAASLNAGLIEYSAGGHNLSGATFNKAMQESIKFLQ